jgi:hypothetical protein
MHGDLTGVGADLGAGRTSFRELPLGAVRARGWLAEQLRLQAKGLTGMLEELWPDVGPGSAWLGGSGEDWERGPYYLDGLVPLAHLTDDPALMTKARRWIEALIGSAGSDGWFGPRSNDDWWPRMVALKALMQEHDATADPRIPGLMARYFAFQAARLPQRPLRDWGRVRAADEVLAIEWLHARTGDPGLRDLADLLLAQAADWGSWLAEMPARGVTRRWDHMTHVVNVAMGLKAPAMRYLRDGSPRHREQLDAGIAHLDRFHGQVHGFFSGDEWLAGTDATRGVELCAVVEAMFSYEQLVRIYGGAYADRLENLAWNLLPAALTADMTAHQYHQQANQVMVTIDQREWTQAGDDCTIFGLEPNFGCCTANLHQGWPKLVRSMWMTTPDGASLAALVHGPSRVSWSREGVAVTIEATTAYPFDERIDYRVAVGRPVAFRLLLRVPGWCADPTLRVNGEPVDAPIVDGFLALERTWADGDEVEVELPMRVSIAPRPSGGVGVRLGPLVLAFSPGEIWSRLPGSVGFGDWEVRPRRSWNIALAARPDEAAAMSRVERLGVPSPPFGLRTGSPPLGIEGVPLRVWVPARRALGWRLVDGSAGPLPSSDAVDESDQDWPVPLVPYGSARVRVAEFPVAAPSRLGLRGLGEAPG